MQNSKRDVYLGACLNDAHWQVVVILPKENVVIWFCSLHNRLDNYLKGIINRLDDTPQSKTKAGARQKGSTECGYYAMHWMSTIILGSFKNNWETYFNYARPLEPERLKALHLQWAKCYLKAEFEIPEASNSRTKKKVLQNVGERWRQFKSDLTRKWALAADKDGVDDTICEKYGISKEKWAHFCQTRRDPLMCGKKHRPSRSKTPPPMCCLVGSGSTEGVINPPSPIRRHAKWKMARTKKTGQMTSEATKKIVEKIDSLEEQTSQGSFVPHGRQDLLTAAIGRPKHPGRVRAAGADVTIKQYFGLAP
ncbi:hypothetical protein GmHk_12G034859 [Glycine max]|nr:hypothetical protein GmHk_12G034859 [Glycine max]